MLLFYKRLTITISVNRTIPKACINVMITVFNNHSLYSHCGEGKMLQDRRDELQNQQTDQKRVVYVVVAFIQLFSTLLLLTVHKF